MSIDTSPQGRSEHSCPLCGASNLTPALTIPAADGAPSGIWQCLNCFCHVPDIALNPTTLATPLEAQIQYHENHWRDCQAAELEQLRLELGRMVQALQPAWGDIEDEREIVEVGCGRGGLLRALLDAGYHARGCEPSDALVQIARDHYGLDQNVLRHCSAEAFCQDLELQAKRPQCIVLWHVLEHLEAPLPLLQRLHGVLPPDGRLILQLPLLHSPYVYPEHYFFVTPDTLPFLSRKLGDLPYRFEIDFDNKFISVFFGNAYVAQQATPSAAENTLWRGSRARGEPLLTRDGAISAKDLELKRLGSALLNVQQELSNAHKRLEEGQECIAAQARMVEERWTAMHKMGEEISRRDAQIEQLQSSIFTQNSQIEQKDACITAQAAMLEERWAAMRKMGEEISRRDAQIEQLQGSIFTQNSQIEQKDACITAQAAMLEERWAAMQEMGDQIFSRQQQIEALQAALYEQALQLTQKDECIAGQARMLEERWASMQAMGKEIFDRDQQLLSERASNIQLNQTLLTVKNEQALLQDSAAEKSRRLRLLQGSTIVRLLIRLKILPSVFD